MERQYVDFPVAKLLKEKGFDIECFSYYRKEGSLFNSYPNYEQDPGNWNGNSFPDDVVSAPEIWQVVEWFKTIHGIWIHVECEPSGLVWFPKVNICSDESWKNEEIRDVVYLVNGKLKTKWFKSDQEAYNAALKYILEELI
jgi:hypothetical protein